MSYIARLFILSSRNEDSDGSHICGLLINFVVKCLPEVLRQRPDFIQRLVTPLLKATHKRRGEQRSFFSMPEFKNWLQNAPDSGAWTMKYYKGLGTSQSKEARDIFRHLANHTVALHVDADAHTRLRQFYDEACANDRKRILTSEYDASSCVDYSLSSCSVSDFMLREHVHFSHYSVFRALPSAIDGLTPARRKVMHYFLSSGAPRDEVKVAQAASGVAQKTLYLHGETSLVETLVGQAQDYIGTNNIALLEPLGQFGSRNDKPSVHSAARYIFTKLDPITRVLFPQADELVLDLREEEGQSIEPVYFVPVVPMLLINGAQGIGTGFSTSVPSYNFYDICSAARSLLAGAPLPAIRPHFQGFIGEVENGSRAVLTRGVLERPSPTCVIIKELPVGRWTEPFLSELKAVAEGTKQHKGLSIVSIANMSTEYAVHIEISLGEESSQMSDEELCKSLKLITTHPTTFMYAFDRDYSLRLFGTPEDILREHAHVRLQMYEKRRAMQLRDMEQRLLVLEARVRFVGLIVSGDINLRGQTREELTAILQREHGLPAIATKRDAEPGFEYLLNMSIHSFTREKMDGLSAESENLRVQRNALEDQTPQTMWLTELNEAEIAYADYERRLAQRHAEEQQVSSSSGRKRAPVAKKRAGRGAQQVTTKRARGA